MESLTDFNQLENHVESSVCGLREIQGSGKYPKKVCSAAMYGANMLNAQKGTISELRHNNDRLVEENAELLEALISLHKQIENRAHKRHILEKDEVQWVSNLLAKHK